MIYEGKEYKEVLNSEVRTGDLLIVFKLNHAVLSKNKHLKYTSVVHSKEDLVLIAKNHSDMLVELSSNHDGWRTYRYVKDVEETSAPKEKNIPLTDSSRYSACNTPAYKLKRSIKKLYEEMSELITAKNENYGNSFSKQYQKYGMVSVEMRLNDKFMRLEQLVSGEKDKVGESIEDTLKDIIGYATLALIELEGEQNGK